ncbi:hypothetical protein EV421DRAFT_1744650 [Armillaria borealis]|uniref:Uncharacterized protein n=1 Tax=Armillaria borealis TaxID=47425 RepID=A0AA39IVK4_9AGAR|nr:hypothetical protein EV421DRAFT_1744650 [Armillaria borealis]
MAISVGVAVVQARSMTDGDESKRVMHIATTPQDAQPQKVDWKSIPGVRDSGMEMSHSSFKKDYTEIARNSDFRNVMSNMNLKYSKTTEETAHSSETGFGISQALNESKRAKGKPRTVLNTSSLPGHSSYPEPGLELDKKEKGGRPVHWISEKPVWFQNPWLSWRTNGRMDMLSMFTHALRNMPALPTVGTLGISVRTPTWGTEDEHNNKIKATWLGHAFLIVKVPFVGSLERGAKVLFDPAFSNRCFPSQFHGPKRYTEPPWKIDDVPETPIMILSLATLFKCTFPPQVLAMLRLLKDHMHTQGWWDARQVEIPGMSFKDNQVWFQTPEPLVEIPLRISTWGMVDALTNIKVAWFGHASVIVVFPGRDTVILFVPPSLQSSASLKTLAIPSRKDSWVRMYFAGTVHLFVEHGGDKVEERPLCSTFKEFGEGFSGFDLAEDTRNTCLFPWIISSSVDAPRWFMLLYIDAYPDDGVDHGVNEESKKIDVVDGGFPLCNVCKTKSSLLPVFCLNFIHCSGNHMQMGCHTVIRVSASCKYKTKVNGSRKVQEIEPLGSMIRLAIT